MNNQCIPILCNTESEFNVQEDTQRNDSSSDSDGTAEQLNIQEHSNDQLNNQSDDTRTRDCLINSMDEQVTMPPIQTTNQEPISSINNSQETIIIQQPEQKIFKRPDTHLMKVNLPVELRSFNDKKYLNIRTKLSDKKSDKKIESASNDPLRTQSSYHCITTRDESSSFDQKNQSYGHETVDNILRRLDNKNTDNNMILSTEMSVQEYDESVSYDHRNNPNNTHMNDYVTKKKFTSLIGEMRLDILSMVNLLSVWNKNVATTNEEIQNLRKDIVKLVNDNDNLKDRINRISEDNSKHITALSKAHNNQMEELTKKVTNYDIIQKFNKSKNNNHYDLNQTPQIKNMHKSSSNEQVEGDANDNQSITTNTENIKIISSGIRVSRKSHSQSRSQSQTSNQSSQSASNENKDDTDNNRMHKIISGPNSIIDGNSFNRPVEKESNNKSINDSKSNNPIKAANKSKEAEQSKSSSSKSNSNNSNSNKSGSNKSKLSNTVESSFNKSTNNESEKSTKQHVQKIVEPIKEKEEISDNDQDESVVNAIMDSQMEKKASKFKQVVPRSRRSSPDVVGNIVPVVTETIYSSNFRQNTRKESADGKNAPPIIDTKQARANRLGLHKHT